MNQILYSRRSNKKPLIIVIVILVIIVLMLSLGFGIANLSNDRILNGVFVNDIDVSNMTKEEAIDVVNSNYEEKENRTLALNYGDYSISVSTEDIGFSYTEADTLVEEAYAYGREGNIFKDNFTVMKSFMNDVKVIEADAIIDMDMLKSIMQSSMSGETVFAKDDEYIVSGDKLIITKGVEGQKVDYEMLKDKILIALSEEEIIVDIPVVVSAPVSIDIEQVYLDVCKEPKDAKYIEGANFEIIKEENGIDFDKADAKARYNALQSGESVEIGLMITEPNIKIEDLGDVLFENLISTYTSTYSMDDKDRVTNLEVAANRCNNTILYPGDEFSYNEALGHRTIANGYKMGNSFAGGKVVKTIGGGICQVSSTLYNAVLRADLTITDRTAHGMYVQYVPQSTDATVVDNAIDFKFRNDGKYPVKLVVTCKDGTVTASVYGFKEDDSLTIDVDVKILETLPYETKTQYDSTMAKGTKKVVQSPVDGYVSESYKVYYKSGKEISRELISKDRYIPTDEIINVGTKVNTPATITPTTPPDDGNSSTTDNESKVDNSSSLLPPGWDNPESGY